MKKFFAMKQNNRLAAVATSGLAAVLSSVLILTTLMGRPAAASDMQTASPSAGAQGDGSHYVRIGVNKSIVIHLPAEARDVVVGNNEIVDAVVRNKNTAYLFARRVGQTNLFFFDANGEQVLALDLEVALDAKALQKLIQRTLPGTRITTDTIGENVILGGVAETPLEAKTALDLANEFIKAGDLFQAGGKIVNTIRVAGEDQVMLQVKVVEIQRQVLKQWGINLKAVLDAGAFAFNISNINPFGSNLIAQGAGYGASIGSGSASLSGVLRAMESDGMVHTLAEPNLTAVSGSDAKFKAGGEFPYQTCSNTSGTTTCAISFKEYGVELNFTPTVLTEGRINLKIHTSVSELHQEQQGSTGGLASVPSLDTRTADTVLEMPDGGSMMLAGLIRENTRQTINGTPGLRKLPILGALFRSRDFITNQTELVVLVTPHIVRSTSQRQLETPDKNLNIATDSQTILLGRLNKLYGKGVKAPTGSYAGSVGYIVE